VKIYFQDECVFFIVIPYFNKQSNILQENNQKRSGFIEKFQEIKNKINKYEKFNQKKSISSIFY